MRFCSQGLAQTRSPRRPRLPQQHCGWGSSSRVPPTLVIFVHVSHTHARGHLRTRLLTTSARTPPGPSSQHRGAGTSVSVHSCRRNGFVRGLRGPGEGPESWGCGPHPPHWRRSRGLHRLSTDSPGATGVRAGEEARCSVSWRCLGCASRSLGATRGALDPGLCPRKPVPGAATLWVEPDRPPEAGHGAGGPFPASPESVQTQSRPALRTCFQE